MNRLHDLAESFGQSPWLDNLRRGWISSGRLQQLIDQGVRGLTSNPSIFQNAMTDTDDYDQQLFSLVGQGKSIEASYWELVGSDITNALDLLHPVHLATNGLDGFVSVEVDPRLAADTKGTISAARHLYREIGRPNLYIKIPATEEGIPAIRTMIGEGCSVNVTLIFSLDRYEQVIEAYLDGLEDYQGDLSKVSSVASFFISRTDTEVDRRLEAIGSNKSLSLRGQTAIAQGQVAYAIFREAFSGPRWEALKNRGARLQRPLWASTSTKNVNYSDTLYVDALIGPDTVNTLPDKTLKAFQEHGTLRRTVDADLALARSILREVEKAGVNLEEVAKVLETEGVAAFVKSFDELLNTLEQKASEIL